MKLPEDVQIHAKASLNMRQIPCNEICLNIEMQEFVSILDNYFHANLSFQFQFSFAILYEERF